MKAEPLYSKKSLLQHSLVNLCAVRSTQENEHGYEYDLTYPCLSAKTILITTKAQASPSCTS